MNKKIILGTSVLLTFSLLASSAEVNMHDRKDNSPAQEHMMKHPKQKHKEVDIVRMFMQLDLDDAQRGKIRTIVKESMKTIPNPSMAFSDTSFDKDEYMKLVKQKKEYKVEHRAQLIEKIYNVLSKSQKKDFKTMLDMQEIMQKKHQMRK